MIINTVEKIYTNVPVVEFECYKITYVNSNKVSLVPPNPENKDYKIIQEWIAAGNTVIDNPPE